MIVRTRAPNESSTILVACGGPVVATRWAGRLERGEKFLQAFEATFDLCLRGRVRDADVLTAPEGFSRHGDYMGVVQQVLGDVACRAHVAASEKLRDVGVGVEGALGASAGQSRDSGEASDDLVAQADVIALHHLHTILRSA